MIQEPLRTPTQIQQIQGQQQQKLQTGYLTGYETLAYQTIPIQLNSHLNSPKILLIASSAIVAKPQSIQTTPRTRIIRVPFLPRSVPLQHLVKQSLPIENGLVKISNLNTVSQDLNDTQENLDLLTGNILNNTHYYSSNPIESEHCYQILYPNTTKSCHQTQPTEQSKIIQTPLTLASMAGIQLTGYDESPMEMSGATPPIATVEEINVPVFIDEYLQQLTQTSTTTAATFITNSTINNNNINNNPINGYANICLQEEQQQAAGEEEEEEVEEESFETLEFDIEMIAEDNNKIVEKFENINNNNNNNNNTTMDYYYSNSDANNTYNNHNNNFNTNNFCEAVEPKEEPQYLISPGMVHYNLSEDTASLGLESDDIVLTEEAIDISSMNNDNFTFSEVFCSSQNDPMLTDGLDNLSQKITDAEPVIPNIDYDAEYAMCIKQQQIKQEDLDIKFELNTTTPFIDTPAATPKSTVSNMVDTHLITKRRRSTSRGMIEKRRKLHLNTSTKITAVPDALNTPDVVNLIADWGKQQQPHLSFGNSSVTTQDIINDLLNMCDSSTYSPLQANADTTCWTALIDDNNSNSTVGTIINNNNANSNDSYTFNSNNTNAHTNNPASVAASPASSSLAYTDEDPPYTPQSFISSTNHTNHTGDFTTSPNSPALSTSTTTTTQTKKRGRPSKEHSDKPDPARLEHLPEAERKKAEDRAKNNEASRLSRLKNKLKEDAEVEEAKKLTERNIEMKAELERLYKISAKLKRALQRRHFRAQ